MNQTLRLSRSADIMPSLDQIGFYVVGVGGIGSNVAHLLASMGADEDVTLIDPDIVAEENIYPGFFHMKDITHPKAYSVADMLLDRYDVDFSGYHGPLDRYATMFDDERSIRPRDVVIICTDTLSSRQMAWSALSQYLCSRVWIDARMGGTLATVYTVMMDNEDAVADYTKELEKGVEGTLPCGEKATAALTKGFIPGMIGQSLHHLMNGLTPPYMQRYDLYHHLHLVQEYAPTREAEPA